MFAVEINFTDGVTSSEILLLRRSLARIGGSSKADVVIDGLACPDLLVRRGLGHEFFCSSVNDNQQVMGKPSFIEGIYQNQAEINLGAVVITIMAIDPDLVSLAEDAKQGAVSNIIRFVMTHDLSRYPVIVLDMPDPVFVSVGANNRFLIGKSRKCGLRLDMKDIEQEHLALTMEDGLLNVEVLSKGKNVFLDNHLLKLKSPWLANQQIRLGEVSFVVLYSEEDFAKYRDLLSKRIAKSHMTRSEEFLLVSSSSVVSPPQLVLEEGKLITVGRDPTNDVWINAGHISRYHAELRRSDRTSISIKDTSSNGVYVNGKRLPLDTEVWFPMESLEIDFKQGIGISISKIESCEDVQPGISYEDTAIISEGYDNVGSDEGIDVIGQVYHQQEINLSVPEEKADISNALYENDRLELDIPARSTRPLFLVVVIGLTVLFALIGIAVGLFNF